MSESNVQQVTVRGVIKSIERGWHADGEQYVTIRLHGDERAYYSYFPTDFNYQYYWYRVVIIHFQIHRFNPGPAEFQFYYKDMEMSYLEPSPEEKKLIQENDEKHRKEKHEKAVRELLEERRRERERKGYLPGF